MYIPIYLYIERGPNSKNREVGGEQFIIILQRDML